MQGVHLEIPALPEYMLIARLTLSGFCTRLNMGVDAMEDAKVALSEACLLLMHRTRCAGVKIDLREEGPWVELEAMAPGQGSEAVAELDCEYSELILQSLAEEWVFQEPCARFRIIRA